MRPAAYTARCWLGLTRLIATAGWIALAVLILEHIAPERMPV